MNSKDLANKIKMLTTKVNKKFSKLNAELKDVKNKLEILQNVNN